jgi:hypothetical protein
MIAIIALIEMVGYVFLLLWEMRTWRCCTDQGLVARVRVG